MKFKLRMNNLLKLSCFGCGLLCLCFFLSEKAWSQEPSIEEQLREDLIREVTQTLQVDGVRFKELISMESKDTAQQEDLLEQMLALPEEKRQYHYPALHISPFISKKVRTHPQIARYKGQVPQNIPSALKSWAQKYLKDLSPNFYPLLDPSLWQLSQESSRDNTKVTFSTHLQHDPTVPFKKITDYYKLPPDLEKNYNQTILSSSDIQGLAPVIQGLYALYNSEQSPLLLKIRLTMLTYLQKQNDVLKTDPFKTRFSQLAQLGYATQLEKIAQAAGFKTAAEFAEKADLILKAWRLNHMSLSMALYLKKHGDTIHEYTDSSSIAKNVTNYIALHEASPGDAKAVKPELNTIYKVFHSPAFEALDLHIPLDFSYRIGYSE